METKVTDNGSTAVIAVKGQINTNTANDAKAVFREVASSHDAVTLDMAEVSYVSSAGIRALRDLYLILYKKGGSLNLEHVSDNVVSVLEMTGLLDLLHLDRNA